MGNGQYSCGCQPEQRDSYTIGYPEERFEKPNMLPRKNVTFGPSDEEEKIFQIGRRKILDVKTNKFLA